MSAPRGISFHVPAAPVSVNRRYVKGHTLSREYRGFRDAVAFYAAQAMRGIQPLEGPVEVSLDFFFWRSGDVDGPIKPCMDGMTGHVYADDKQVEGFGRVWRYFVPTREERGVTISVREIA